MSALQRLSRLAVVPVAPLIYLQGRRLQRETPRLPDAALPWQGTIDGPRALRLLVLGDSTAAGVGASTQVEGLPGNLARALAARWSRGVEWTAIGENGATARDLVVRFLDGAAAERWDFVFVSIGANDALGLRSQSAFGRDIHTVLTRLRESSPDAPIIMSSLPAFFRFVLLPNPLRWNLYLHSQSLEGEARRVAASLPGVIMSPPPPPYSEGFFAEDLFHPSATGYCDWANFAIDDAFASGALS